MHNLVERLATTSHSISKDEFIMYLLTGFSLDFNMIICQIQAWKGSMSLEKVDSSLVGYETCLYQHTNFSLIANVASTSSSNGLNGAPSSNLTAKFKA